MASTTFINYQTVIDASWLNDVNSAVYSGTFQASTISPTNISVSGTATFSGTITGTAISNYLASPPAIGGTSPSTGKFTSLTDTGLTSGRVTYATTGGLLTDSANMTFNGTTLTLANDASISGLTVGKGASSVATNTALGVNSLLNNNASATTNTGLGYNTLNANTSGIDGTAVGAYALYKNTTGNYNSALGGSNSYPALYNNTTGSSNSAFGVGALFSNTTASNNTAVGYQALYSQTNPSGTNTALGYVAGYTNTTGVDNVYIGHYAGQLNSTGVGQTFLGANAGQNTTASSNTFLGCAAGYTVTSGAKNTIIGRYNGNQGGLDIRTASNYIVLSDGDGNPRGWWDNNGIFHLTTANGYAQQTSITATGGVAWSPSYTPSTGTPFYAYFNYNGSNVGNINATSVATVYATTSDKRLKENIVDAPSALSKINSVKIRSFDWINTKENVDFGVIAQELYEVVPNAVCVGVDHEDGTLDKPWGVDTSFLVPAMIKAIQELNAKVTALEAKLGA